MSKYNACNICVRMNFAIRWCKLDMWEDQEKCNLNLKMCNMCKTSACKVLTGICLHTFPNLSVICAV